MNRDKGLLPCPFCGGAVEDVGGGAIWHIVREGYVTCPAARVGFPIETWNRRSHPTGERDKGLEEAAQIVERERAKMQGRWSLDSAYLGQAIEAIRALKSDSPSSGPRGHSTSTTTSGKPVDTSVERDGGNRG